MTSGVIYHFKSIADPESFNVTIKHRNRKKWFQFVESLEEHPAIVGEFVDIDGKKFQVLGMETRCCARTGCCNPPFRKGNQTALLTPTKDGEEW